MESKVAKVRSPGKNYNKKRKILNSAETMYIIEVWRNHDIDLRSNKRNIHIYSSMQEELNKTYGLKLSVEGIKNRVKNLTKKFRSEVLKRGASGGAPSDWEYFEVLQEFIGHHKSNRGKEFMEESISSNILDVDDILDVGLDVESIYPRTEPETSAQFLPQMTSPTPRTSSSSENIMMSPPPVAASPVPSFSRSAKKKNFNERFLKLVEEEADTFKKFCAEAKEADMQHIQQISETNELLKQSNKFQEQLINFLTKN